MQSQNRGLMAGIGSAIALLCGVILFMDFIGSGLAPVGAWLQIGSLRGLNMLDAMRGKPTEAVEVDNVPQFQGCEKNEDGSANCKFED